MRQLFPEIEIHLVVSTLTYPLAVRCPYVDRVIVFDSGRGIPPLRHTMQAWRAFRFARRQFRAIDFDLAVVPRWDVDDFGSNALAYFSGARYRVAFSERATPEKALFNRGFDSFATHVIESNKISHEVEHSLEMLRFFGARVADSRLEVWTDAADEFFAEALLDRHGVTTDRVLVAIAPGASEAKKRWQTSHFAEVGGRIQTQFNAVVVLLGTGSDGTLAAKIAKGVGRKVIDLTGQTTLRQTVALLRRTTIFIGNCSGPLHLAAAAGVPVVEISCHPRNGRASNSYSPIRFGPWLVPHRVLQPDRPTPPCSECCEAYVPHCILNVSVDLVARSACDLLERIVGARTQDRYTPRVPGAADPRRISGRVGGTPGEEGSHI
jgi:heptosyltransferase-2